MTTVALLPNSLGELSTVTPLKDRKEGPPVQSSATNSTPSKSTFGKVKPR